MCGGSNAGKPVRGSYVKAGVRCDEQGMRGRDKRMGRRMRRRAERMMWQDEAYDG